jgi:hypothetical protein
VKAVSTLWSPITESGVKEAAADIAEDARCRADVELTL